MQFLKTFVISFENLLKNSNVSLAQIETTVEK